MGLQVGTVRPLPLMKSNGDMCRKAFDPNSGLLFFIADIQIRSKRNPSSR